MTGSSFMKQHRQHPCFVCLTDMLLFLLLITGAGCCNDVEKNYPPVLDVQMTRSGGSFRSITIADKSSAYPGRFVGERYLDIDSLVKHKVYSDGDRQFVRLKIRNVDPDYFYEIEIPKGEFQEKNLVAKLVRSPDPSSLDRPPDRLYLDLKIRDGVVLKMVPKVSPDYTMYIVRRMPVDGGLLVYIGCKEFPGLLWNLVLPSEDGDHGLVTADIVSDD